MANIIVLGAAGNLGTQVVQRALDAGHSVTALVRTPGKLPSNLLAHVRVVHADLTTLPVPALTAILSGHDVAIHTAGYVSDGLVFTALMDHIVAAVESIDAPYRPVLWVTGGAAVLDLGDLGIRGVDLPAMAGTYWPHADNLKRLEASALDWRMVCPGPMVHGPGVGLAHMRISMDVSPLPIPAEARGKPLAEIQALVLQDLPQMIVSYADVAALILAHLEPSGAGSRRRWGIALPVGMVGEKAQWKAAPAVKRSTMAA